MTGYSRRQAVAVSDPRLVSLASNALTAGEFVPPRLMMTAAQYVTATSQTMWMTYFTADKSEIISNLSVATGSTAAAATPTLCRMGLYTIDGSGNGTLVASTPNDTTLFAATTTIYTKALSASYAKVAGQRYACALLVVSSAAMPVFHGLQLPATTVVSTWTRLAPAIAGRVLSQTDLPSTFVVGSVAGYQAVPSFYLS